MKNHTETAENGSLTRLSRAWSLISLGLLLGSFGTCLFFRKEIEGASSFKGLQFYVVVLIILTITSVPTSVFEGIRAVRAWQQIRRRNAEQVGRGKRE